MPIVIENLNFSIDKNHILKNISALFEDGKIHGLVGRNGSGKTMLMKCICGFIFPDEGTITVNGKIIGEDTDFPDSIGFIIEIPGFIPFYSGFKNLELLSGLRGIINKEQIKESMRMVGLDPELKRHVRKYSLGMRQRLGLAQALMENPEILILDEPFNGLDNDGVKEMREYLLKLKNEGKNIVIASHSMDDIKVLCDDVYVMDRGELSIASQNVDY